MDIISIPLDGRIASNLLWEDAVKKVGESKGSLVWKMDLGLFDTLEKPLSDSMQFRSLGLSLNHFTENVYPLFTDRNQTMILYQGHYLGKTMAQWIEEKDYLCSLCLFLPEDLKVEAHLDVSGLKELYPFAKLAVAGGGDQVSVVFHHSPIPIYEEANLGVSIHFKESVRTDRLESYLESCLSESKPFRLVNEAFLTDQWGELDEIVVEQDSISEQEERMLLGFSAAGGKVTRLGEEN